MTIESHDELLKRDAAACGRIIQLQACCETLCQLVLELVPKLGIDGNALHERLKGQVNQKAQDQLERLKTVDPDLAAATDILPLESLLDMDAANQ